MLPKIAGLEIGHEEVGRARRRRVHGHTVEPDNVGVVDAAQKVGLLLSGECVCVSV